MSAFNSDRYFRFRQIVTGQVIETSRPCRRCGYNLRGLNANRKCPECGTPIAASLFRKLADDTLGNAPVGYLVRIRIGAALLLASPLVLALLTMVGPLVRQAMQGPAGDRVVLSCLFLPPLLWAAGCFLVSTPRPSDGMPQGNAYLWRHRRWTLRLTALVWSVVPICFLVLSSAGNLSPTGKTTVLVTLAAAFVLGLLNTAALSHYFSLLCSWAYALAMSRSFALLIWGFGAGLIMAITYLLAAANVTISFTSKYAIFFGTLAALLWLASMLYVLWRLADINTMTMWALRNSRTRAAYHERQRLGKTGATSAQVSRDALMDKR
jgi:hypothetical protein